MKRCARCILPDRFLNLTFDDEGVCSLCREPQTQQGHEPAARRINDEVAQRKLTNLLERERAKGGRHDCIVSFSGGKDSIYTLYLLRRFFNANPLLVMYDNGYMSDACQAMIRTCADTFGVDLVSYRPSSSEQTVLLRTFFERTGEIGFTCDVEVYSLIVRTARERNIELALMGGGGASEGISQLTQHRAVDVFEYAKRYLQEIPGVDLHRLAVSTSDFEKLRIVQMGDFVRWDHDEILRVIRDELRLEYPGADDGAYMHSECHLCRLQDHVRYLKRGYGRNEPVLAALVRHGILDRGEALRRANAEAAVAAEKPDVLKGFCARLGYSEEQLYAVVDDPNIVYRPPWYHGES